MTSVKDIVMFFVSSVVQEPCIAGPVLMSTRRFITYISSSFRTYPLKHFILARFLCYTLKPELIMRVTLAVWVVTASCHRCECRTQCRVASRCRHGLTDGGCHGSALSIIITFLASPMTL